MKTLAEIMALAEIKTLAETRPLLKKHKINYQKNRHGNRSLSFRRLRNPVRNGIV